jgi:enamine deaminase RidA (YjgF/YER057c/UK114 family)
MRHVAVTRHNPADVFPPYVGYAHAVEVPAGARTLYVSGLNGFEADGVTMPASFEEQAHLIWRHLGRILAHAGMTLGDVVSLRFYLAEPSYDAANVQILEHHLGEHRAARTVVCARLLDPRWLIELEAVAARHS